MADAPQHTTHQPEPAERRTASPRRGRPVSAGKPGLRVVPVQKKELDLRALARVLIELALDEHANLNPPSATTGRTAAAPTDPGDGHR